MVRRPERALGVAIRKGQDAGEIETPIEAKERAGQTRQHGVTYTELNKPRPVDYAQKHELSNSQGGIYDMTDAVSDEQFEEGLADAKFEENMSRANPTALKRRIAPCSIPKDTTRGT